VTTSRPRVDDLGRAYAGSQLQTQIYVTRYRDALAEAIQRALSDAAAGPRAAIDWIAPLEAVRFVEPRLRPFLPALGLAHRARDLSQFWPTRGPRWDALAVLRYPEAAAPGALLVEAKSYPGEVYGSGCSANSTRSRALIKASLARAQAWLGVPPSTDWLGRLYQYGNRLAHLFFLRDQLGIDAWLVNLCFTNDRTHHSTHKSVTESSWRAVLPKFKHELGFSGDRIPWAIDVLLPARSRDDLIDHPISPS
jgi:hypothetical protein